MTARVNSIIDRVNSIQDLSARTRELEALLCPGLVLASDGAMLWEPIDDRESVIITILTVDHAAKKVDYLAIEPGDESPTLNIGASLLTIIRDGDVLLYVP